MSSRNADWRPYDSSRAAARFYCLPKVSCLPPTREERRQQFCRWETFRELSTVWKPSLLATHSLSQRFCRVRERSLQLLPFDGSHESCSSNGCHSLLSVHVHWQRIPNSVSYTNHVNCSYHEFANLCSCFVFFADDGKKYESYIGICH